jgi:cell division protein ZipA
VPSGDPPLVTIDDLPENTDSVVLAPAPLPEERVPPVAPAVSERRRPRPDPPRLEPVVALEPADATLAVPLAEPPPAPPVEPPPRQQRIVAIRLIGDREQRIDGAELKRSLASEGLEFGRYSIFHRLLQGGRPAYSIASLVEPGSFDPELMDSIRLPGISLFAVFPGPVPAPQAFDDMLATARRLADRLGGALQDDSGSSLTGQRVLSIREELVHFEHLVALSRARPGA